MCGNTSASAFTRRSFHGAYRLSEAPSFGKCIFEYDPNGSGAKAYRALADEFLRRHETALETPNANAADESGKQESTKEGQQIIPAL